MLHVHSAARLGSDLRCYSHGVFESLAKGEMSRLLAAHFFSSTKPILLVESPRPDLLEACEDDRSAFLILVTDALLDFFMSMSGLKPLTLSRPIEFISRILTLACCMPACLVYFLLILRICFFFSRASGEILPIFNLSPRSSSRLTEEKELSVMLFSSSSTFIFGS